MAHLLLVSKIIIFAFGSREQGASNITATIVGAVEEVARTQTTIT